MSAARYGIFTRWHVDGDGKRWACFQPGTIALTASAATRAYAQHVRAGLLSFEARAYLGRGAQRARARREEHALRQRQLEERRAQREHALEAWASSQDW